MSTENDEPSGRPKEGFTDENIKKIHKMILNDRKLNLNEIADNLKMSTERVNHIIHEYWGMRKLCARPEFLRRYVTMDERWLHHFTPKSNRQSSGWTAHDEPATKRGKTQQSAGKVMTSIFWDAHGIIFIDYLEKGRTINSEYYIELLNRLKDKNSIENLEGRYNQCITLEGNYVK
ncbi:hypothetical protein GWI33_020156 [Rhynchophorus ferrugineus]|uniref:Transposase n=1 Tax=Rhynchophorus ferrugineus TaxID=354439 RepID=A0A834LZQ2_RHYFE|nr:hypothetical protein GWI33_020156 [Rhynchophorus ferrugineus]